MICFSERLHMKRAEIIEELYSRLNRLEAALSAFEFFLSILNEGRDDYMSPVRDVVDYYNDRRIYFSLQLCSAIDNFIQAIRSPMDQYNYAHRGNSNEEKARMFWENIENKRSEAYEAKKAIENELRTLLGVVL
jgi:hypothetical protein